MGFERYLYDENELPLDKIIDDGGYAAIFRSIACVGDSLSSGEFEVKNESGVTVALKDIYEYSWGQFLGRMIGSKVYNFSAGGLTASAYVNDFA